MGSLSKDAVLASLALSAESMKEQGKMERGFWASTPCLLVHAGAHAREFGTLVDIGGHVALLPLVVNTGNCYSLQPTQWSSSNTWF